MKVSGRTLLLTKPISLLVGQKLDGSTKDSSTIVTFWREEGDKYQDTLKIEAMEDLEDLEDFMMYLYESSFNQSIPGKNNHTMQ